MAIFVEGFKHVLYKGYCTKADISINNNKNSIDYDVTLTLSDIMPENTYYFTTSSKTFIEDIREKIKSIINNYIKEQNTRKIIQNFIDDDAMWEIVDE